MLARMSFAVFYIHRSPGLTTIKYIVQIEKEYAVSLGYSSG
jgi:hypothetical protein